MRKRIYILCYNIAVEQDLHSHVGGWVYRIGRGGEDVHSNFSPLGFLQALNHLKECKVCRAVNASLESILS
ncbi:MAG: hypothetical protein ABDH32_04360 [Candidatus Caldarchaeales archaeon]